MAPSGSDRREGASSGGRSQRAPISFTGPSSSTHTQTQRAPRIAHPGGVITRVYPPGFDPNDRTHRFERQRSASGTPVPSETPAPALRQTAASRVRRDSHDNKSRLHGRHDARGHQQSFPLGLPPHLDSPGLMGINDSAQPMADSLDGPWPAYDPIDDDDAEEDGHFGRSHAVQQTPPAPRTGARGAAGGASSAGTALDFGMATPAPAVHGSMAADFEAGAPVAYVNEAPLRGYDAYVMQERIADQKAELEELEREANAKAAEAQQAEAWQAEAAARRAKAARVRADAKARMRAVQAAQSAEQPLEEDESDADVAGHAAFRVADRSNGAHYTGRAVPASELGTHSRFSYLSRGDAGRAGPQRQAPLTAGRIVIPEGWDDDDEPMDDSCAADDYAAPRDLGHRSTATRLSRGIREVHMADGWGDGLSAGHRSGVAGRIVHAPKHINGGASGRVVTALQTSRRPNARPTAQPAAVRTTSRPAPAPQISVEDRLNMSLDSIAAQQKVPLRAQATPRGLGNGGVRGRGRSGGRHSAAGRGADDAGAENGTAARDDGQRQQTVAAEQKRKRLASGAGQRAVQTVLRPADKLNMSLDQIQKRQRV